MCWVSEGNHRPMPEQQTEFSLPELIYNSTNVNIKRPHFQFANRAMKCVMVQ